MKRKLILLCLILGATHVARAQGPVCFVNGVRVGSNTVTDVDVKLSAASIDQSVIDNVEVLKGLAAVRLYGPDAVYGVIQITTKKGASINQNWAAICGPTPSTASDPFSRYLYPPEFVMAHQQAIGLTDLQKFNISEAVRDAQSKTLDPQFKLAAATEKFGRTLAASKVDPLAVIDQIEDVLNLERIVKRAQIVLLVRVKNQLTPEQQVALDKLR